MDSFCSGPQAASDICSSFLFLTPGIFTTWGIKNNNNNNNNNNLGQRTQRVVADVEQAQVHEFSDARRQVRDTIAGDADRLQRLQVVQSTRHLRQPVGVGVEAAQSARRRYAEPAEAVRRDVQALEARRHRVVRERVEGVAPEVELDEARQARQGRRHGRQGVVGDVEHRQGSGHGRQGVVGDIEDRQTWRPTHSVRQNVEPAVTARCSLMSYNRRLRVYTCILLHRGAEEKETVFFFCASFQYSTET